ncbi:hypothetical protein [Methylosinus sp. Sm6]|uniref:hypothetical protein n=1 Tax=Methylosinus sp. Sm6 TaxID=2866948 RepID=UPI001C998DE1|nr:hypothetical protein [Methylosinus sp. Sm6]MBY6239655.1 hypothetical protein [Methylosinus sp. Sm6]
MSANRLDLTSTYIDLSFEGFVDISRDDDTVIYRFSGFVIRFVTTSTNAIKYIKLDMFSIGIAHAQPEKSLRGYVTICSTLNAENPRQILPNIEFRLPSEAVIECDYVCFSVRGEITTKFVEKAGGLPDEVSGRAIWPITAPGNRWIENPDARRPEIRYKRPADPSDPCAPEWIR